jgi:hypothetical protein
MWSSVLWDIIRTWHGSLSAGVSNVASGLLLLQVEQLTGRSKNMVALSCIALKLARSVTSVIKNECNDKPKLLHRRNDVGYFGGLAMPTRSVQRIINRYTSTYRYHPVIVTLLGHNFALDPKMGVPRQYRVRITRKFLSRTREYIRDFNKLPVAFDFATRMLSYPSYASITIFLVVVRGGRESMRVIRVVKSPLESSAGVG